MKSIEQKVMKKVRRVYYLRKATSITALRLYGTIALTALFGSLVSIQSVWANMPPLMSPVNVLDFLYRAVVNTDLAVQGIGIGLALLTVLLVRDIVRGVRSEAHPLLVRA